MRRLIRTATAMCTPAPPSHCPAAFQASESPENCGMSRLRLCAIAPVWRGTDIPRGRRPTFVSKGPPRLRSTDCRTAAPVHRCTASRPSGWHPPAHLLPMPRRVPLFTKFSQSIPEFVPDETEIAQPMDLWHFAGLTLIRF